MGHPRRGPDLVVVSLRLVRTSRPVLFRTPVRTQGWVHGGLAREEDLQTGRGRPRTSRPYLDGDSRWATRRTATTRWTGPDSLGNKRRGSRRRVCWRGTNKDVFSSSKSETHSTTLGFGQSRCTPPLPRFSLRELCPHQSLDHWKTKRSRKL